jgi:hypothetical protein
MVVVNLPMFVLQAKRLGGAIKNSKGLARARNVGKLLFWGTVAGATTANGMIDHNGSSGMEAAAADSSADKTTTMAALHVSPYHVHPAGPPQDPTTVITATATHHHGQAGALNCIGAIPHMGHFAGVVVSAMASLFKGKTR